MTQLRNKQEGFAAIVVTMIIMIVLTLITVGFVRLVGREQRQSLDKQLSTQAFYAAEAGINDAVRKISSTDPATRFTRDKPTCAPMPPDFPAADADLGGGVSYSCILIDQAPITLEYGSVGMSNPTNIPINGQNFASPPADTPVSRIRISWQAESPPPGPTFPTAANASAATFPSAAAWASANRGAGVLRISLTPVSGVLSRQSLIQNTFTAFLYPTATGANSSNSFNFPANPAFGAEQGRVIAGHCNTANNGTAPVGNPTFYRMCNVDIANLNGANYWLTIRSIYTTSTVTISAFNGAANPSTQLRLARAQALVDSTGKAGDILRRVQVRVPSRADYTYPGFALEAGSSICKRYSIYPGGNSPVTDAACSIP